MTVSDAIATAKTEICNLFPEVGPHLRLEEAETPLSTGKNWRLTFSMPSPEPPEIQSTALLSLLRATRARKVVELDRDSGDLMSIKNS